MPLSVERVTVAVCRQCFEETAHEWWWIDVERAGTRVDCECQRENGEPRLYTKRRLWRCLPCADDPDREFIRFATKEAALDHEHHYGA